ncbi:MAG TPA: DUF4331 family protein [Gemmatimonadaceae bacterium]|jgi:hypothetical protein
MYKKLLSRGRARTLLAFGIVASVGVAGAVVASDHQDTPEVELNPRMDINDVYAFPGGNGTSADRVTLVMTTSSPIIGQDASFDPRLLYQLKIDNSGDAKEDLIFQITFDNGAGGSQRYSIVGPVAPATSGTPPAGGVVNQLVNGPRISGNVGTSSGSATGVQAFAGLRTDPFFIDLEQFFKIVPDRRPSTGPLSIPLTQEASSFRNPGVDLLGSLRANALAIVIEVPKSMLVTSTGADAKFGVWGTISR